MFIERRLHPRVNVKLPVEITFTDDNTLLMGETINLSLSGMQIKINKATADYIVSKKIFPLAFLVSIDTPHLKAIHLKARLIVNRRTSADEFQVGIKLCDVESSQLNQLKVFIDSIQA